MGFFDQAFDNMSWNEVCVRLPSQLAIDALKRRITNLDTLKMFFDNLGIKGVKIKDLRDYVNSVVSNYSIDDIFSTFDEQYHPTLFNWIEDSNAKRIKEGAKDKLSVKFLFNLTDSKDEETLTALMERVLAETEVVQSQVRSILRKADDCCLPPLIDRILKDKRPNIRAHILCVPGLTNKAFISDHQKTIGLKALIKCDDDKALEYINVMSINVFSNLRPDERMIALHKYLNYFPQYHKIPAFDPVPSQEEFDMILFAGCVEQNELMITIKDQYEKITKADLPAEEKDED